MLRCKDIAAHASEHIDGELNWKQSLGYGLHLLVCGYCRRFVRQLRTTIACARAVAADDALAHDEARRISERVYDHASRP
jgi:hypothetical protein